MPGKQSLGPHGFGVVIDATDAESPIVRTSSQVGAWPIVSRSGELVATLYGLIIERWAHSAIEVGGGEIRWNGDPADVQRFEREVVDGLNGAFVVVTQAPLPPRLYLDSGGQIPIVFDAASRLAGASANDILSDEEYARRFLADRVERLIKREGGRGWIAGTLTAHEGVHRLLPNYYLDLSTFTAHRHWPAPDFAHSLTAEQAADRVAEALRGFINAAAEQMQVAGTLTAGFDTRVLVAASRELRDDMLFVTFTPPTPGLDQLRAVELAKKLGLQHRLLPIVEADEAQQERWDRLVGHTVHEVNRRIHPTLGEVPADLIFTGLYGVSGRSVPYKQDYLTVDQEKATARNVLTRLALPAEPDLLGDVERWLEPIAHFPRSVVLDLAYNELRFGSWAMAQAPAQKAVKMSLSPMAQRAVLHAFMATPPAEKQTTRLFTMIAERNWPETMALSVNRFGDWRDKAATAKKLFDAQKIRRFVRKKAARFVS